MNISKSSLRNIYCSLNWMFFLIWNSWQMRRLARKLSLARSGRMMKGSFWMCSCCQRSRFSLSGSDGARFRSQCALRCGSLWRTGSRWCGWQTHSASKAMHLAFIDSHFHCFSLQATITDWVLTPWALITETDSPSHTRWDISQVRVMCFHVGMLVNQSKVWH